MNDAVMVQTPIRATSKEKEEFERLKAEVTEIQTELKTALNQMLINVGGKLPAKDRAEIEQEFAELDGPFPLVNGRVPSCADPSFGQFVPEAQEAKIATALNPYCARLLRYVA